MPMPARKTAPAWVLNTQAVADMLHVQAVRVHRCPSSKTANYIKSGRAPHKEDIKGEHSGIATMARELGRFGTHCCHVDARHKNGSLINTKR